jgi:hypothetical protein
MGLLRGHVMDPIFAGLETMKAFFWDVDINTVDTTWDMVKTYLREREKELTRELYLEKWQSTS